MKPITIAALASTMLITNGAVFDPPGWRTLEQNTRTVEWLGVPRLTVAQGSSRAVRISGPWMDRISSVVTSGGVSGRNISSEASAQSSLVLDATTGASRGDKTIQVNIVCRWGEDFFGCRNGPVNVPVKVLETGPINHIYPNGTVPPNTVITFDLDGEAFDVARILGRLTTLKYATIVSRTATTMKVRGTTPQCGFIDVSLSDIADGDEVPYRKGPAIQQVLSGTICGRSIVPPALSSFNPNCPSGQTFDWNSKTCNDD